jgi:hypothetical protein
MEAHAGTIGIQTGDTTTRKPRARRLHLFRERIRARGRERAIRNHSAGANRGLPGSIPGSEHTHLLPPKAY